MSNAEIVTRVCDGYSVAALRGELDTTNAEWAASEVAALPNDRQLIIDLASLDFIDCHAASALLRVRKAIRQAGGDLLLAAPRGPVQRLLMILGVAGVYVTVAAAVENASRQETGERAGAPDTHAGV